MVLLILSERKRAGTTALDLGWRNPRKEQRHGSRITFESIAEVAAQLAFFSSHDDVINDCEVGSENASRNPRMHCPHRTSRKNCTAKIQRIPRERVRSRRRQHFLLFKIARRVTPDPQTNNADRPSDSDSLQVWPGEKQNNNRQRIAQTHSPPRYPFCRATHEVAFTTLIALNTSSTETRRSDGCGASSRL